MPFSEKKKNHRYSLSNLFLDLLLAIPELLLLAVRSLLIGCRYAVRWVLEIL